MRLSIHDTIQRRYMAEFVSGEQEYCSSAHSDWLNNPDDHNRAALLSKRDEYLQYVITHNKYPIIQRSLLAHLRLAWIAFVYNTMVGIYKIKGKMDVN